MAVRWCKGARGPSEHATFRDPETGIRVHRLTDHASISHPTYFLQCSFAPDQSYVLFSGYRSGTAQLFTVGFPDGEIRQLTDGAAIHPFSALIAPDGVMARSLGLFNRRPSTLSTTLSKLPSSLNLTTFRPSPAQPYRLPSAS